MRVRSFWTALFALAVMAMGLAVPTPSSAADSEIVVRARGRLGNENVDLLVNGSAVASWELDGSWFKDFVYKVPAGVTVENLRVRNDSGGWPSSVIVDWVELDGQRFDSSDRWTLSSGSWDSVNGCADGYKLSDWLSCDNSWFDYDLTGSGRVLSVTARGRLGTENVDLLLDGVEAASWELGTSFETFYHRLAPGQYVEELRLRNDSGGWPSAVIADRVNYGGVDYKTDGWRTLSSGSWTAADGCSEGVRFSNWLTCDNSWFDYGVNPVTPKYRVIEVVARGRLGGETIDLMVNGRRFETWSLETSFDTYRQLYLPSYPVESLEIRSTNGGWPNAVIVDYVKVDGYMIDSSDGRTMSSGSWEPANGCDEGNKRSDWLSCSNAWFKYDLRSARDPLP